MILVTGAAGKTGRAVTAALAERGATVRALVHREEQAAVALSAGADDVVVGDQRTVGDVAVALAGCEAVYAIAPNMSPDEREMGEALVDACERTGVSRVVYHSVIHPHLRALAHHIDKLWVEEVLVESGLAWTILRPCAYLQNLAGYLDEMADDGVYRVPYRTDVPSQMVDLDDVAEIAAMVLIEDGHLHAAYDLCGPEPLTADDIAATVSDHLGRSVRAERTAPQDWAAGPGAGLDGETRDRLLAMFTHYDTHGVPGNPTVLSALLRRNPRGLGDVLPRLWQDGGLRSGSK